MGHYQAEREAVFRPHGQPEIGEVEMFSQALIDNVKVTALRIPTESPEADGTLAWDATELVVVHVEAAGESGMGYSYTAAKPAAALVESQLAPCILHRNAFDLPKHWLTMQQRLRNLGRPGLGMMAIAAVDIALWDLKAKLLNVSLAQLIGAADTSVRAYGSGGFTSYADMQLQEQLAGWLAQGLSAVKIKVGADLNEAIRRVALARSVIGNDAQLMIDANGAYDARSALQLIDAIKPYNVSWLEEPVSSDDLAGLAWVRDRAPGSMAIAAGEYGWDAGYFYHMLAAGAVDVLQADATRCGYTGFQQAAALASVFHIPLSAHCAPALHAPFCVTLNGFLHLEYFYDHVRIESVLFTGMASLGEGRLGPEIERPGHGLSLSQTVAEGYRL